MTKIEKIREFLYDLDKIRSDANAVNDLILNYNGISDSESESDGFEIQLQIGEIDEGEGDIQIHIEVNGSAESVWMDISGASDAEIKRLENKKDEVIFKQKI